MSILSPTAKAETKITTPVSTELQIQVVSDRSNQPNMQGKGIKRPEVNANGSEYASEHQESKKARYLEDRNQTLPMQEVVENADSKELDGSPKTPATPLRPMMKVGGLQISEEAPSGSRNANAATGHLSERIPERSKSSKE